MGRHELLAELGRGGMASVYLARGFGSAGFERLAAVKLLHRNLCADQDFVEMFLDEARVAARLHHPNTTAILDVGSEGPQLYMVMDYVEGDTLHAVQCAATAVRRAVPLGIALRVVLDALAGLDAAHELRGADGESLGLIHRDATPHNILIGVDGAARLVDFGIARAAGRIGVTSVGVLKGKLPFMAPEQIRGRPIDRRADVFAMGVTLWETIALRRCFPSREGAPLSRLADEGYRSLREVAPQVPDALDAICRRALAFDRNERFDSAAAFAEAIEDAFRADLATQRELGQFMSVVAAEKLVAEREAARRSSHPMPSQPVRASRATTPVPAIDLRPPRVPTFGPPAARPIQSPLGDGLMDEDDVTAIAHPTRLPPAVVKKHRPLTLPPLPPRERPSIAPRKADADASELQPQAFPLQRPRPSLVPPLPAAPKAGSPSLTEHPDDDGRVSEVRIVLPAARASAVAGFDAAPVVLELPRPPTAPELPAAPTPPPRAEGWFRVLLRRLWSRSKPG